MELAGKMRERIWRRPSPAIWLSASLLAAVLSAAYAQYPGHVDTRKRAGPSPRAIAVLEWTGEPGKPSASRLIPISVFDGETYQPGGLYLARPAPLALDPGTEYVLQQAGMAKGLFDVNSAQDMQGYWFGYGSWHPMAPAPKPHTLHAAKVMPEVVDDGRPHFKNGSSSTRPDSPSTTDSSKQAPDDPDRPVLRRRSASSASSGESGPSFAPAGPETAIGGADPDRPHLNYGSNNPTGAKFEATKLTGTPLGLEQMIAVSDAVDRDPHPFAYSWADPGNAAKMQAQMEALAQKALAPPAPPPGKTVTANAHAAKPGAGTAAARRRRKATAPAAPLAVLTDEHFKAFELTYGGGATLVFSAQSTGAGGKTRYVTLIAQPDFYAVAHVIFQSVTDDNHLDETPRMRLIDAVDARANNRGDLVFELRGRHDRQFAIYRVAEGQVEQVFTTGSLPDTKVG